MIIFNICVSIFWVSGPAEQIKKYVAWKLPYVPTGYSWCDDYTQQQQSHTENEYKRSKNKRLEIKKENNECSSKFYHTVNC